MCEFKPHPSDQELYKKDNYNLSRKKNNSVKTKIIK